MIFDISLRVQAHRHYALTSRTTTTIERRPNGNVSFVDYGGSAGQVTLGTGDFALQNDEFQLLWSGAYDRDEGPIRADFVFTLDSL